MSLLSALLDLIFPAKCPFCGRVVDRGDPIPCPKCRDTLPGWSRGMSAPRRRVQRLPVSPVVPGPGP